MLQIISEKLLYVAYDIGEFCRGSQTYKLSVYKA